MTEKDLELIRLASKETTDHEYIKSLIPEAESQEAKEMLADMEQRAFIRCEQSYGEDY